MFVSIIDSFFVIFIHNIIKLKYAAVVTVSASGFDDGRVCLASQW